MKQSNSKSDLFPRGTHQPRSKEFPVTESRTLVKKEREKLFQDVLKKNREKTQPNENNNKPDLQFAFFANGNNHPDEYLLKTKLQKLFDKPKQPPHHPRPKSSSNAKHGSPKLQKILYCEPKKTEHKKKQQSDSTKEQTKSKPPITIKQASATGHKKSSANHAERSSQTSGGFNPSEQNAKRPKKKKGNRAHAEHRNSSSRSIDTKSKDHIGDQEMSDYFLDRFTKQTHGVRGVPNQKTHNKREEEKAETAAKIIQHGVRNWIQTKSPKSQKDLKLKTGRIRSDHSLETSKKEKPDKSIASDSNKKSTPQKTYIIRQNSSNAATPIGKDSSETFSNHFNKRKSELKDGPVTPNKETSQNSIKPENSQRSSKPLPHHLPLAEAPISSGGKSRPAQVSTSLEVIARARKQQASEREALQGPEILEVNTVTSKNFSKTSSFRGETPKEGDFRAKAANFPLLTYSDFGKQDYKNWVKVRNMIAEIESKLGNRAADDVKSLLKQIEAVSEHSKKNVKETFLANDLYFRAIIK